MDHEERPLTRDDFADNEGWMRHLHEGGLVPDGDDEPYEVRAGDGHYGSLYRAINGHTLRDFAKHWLFWGWSAFLTFEQVVKSYHAAICANAHGRVLNAFVTVTWSTVGIWDDDRISDCHNRFLEGLRKWHEQFGTELAAIWVLERGQRRGLHTHVLLNVPKKREAAFATCVARLVHTITGEPLLITEDSTTVHVQVRGDHDIAGQWGWLKYVWKGINPDDGFRHPAHCDGTRISLAQVLGVRPEFQGEIGRKRLGVSRNLDQAAFEKVWSEGLPPVPEINGWASPDTLYTRWWITHGLYIRGSLAQLRALNEDG